MIVAVLGATGRTGKPLVEALVRRGHHVRALVRDPAKLSAPGEHVTVVTGDSRDPEALAVLLEGADAVVSALGPTSREGDLHTRTAEALVEAMGSAGISRFVGVSGAGIDIPGDQKSTSGKVISRLIQTFGGDVVKDKPAEYLVYAASGLDWTLVRPPRLVDGDATGNLEHDAHRSTRSTRITRADLAEFLVDCLEQDLYPRQAPFIATES